LAPSTCFTLSVTTMSALARQLWPTPRAFSRVIPRQQHAARTFATSLARRAGSDALPTPPLSTTSPALDSSTSLTLDEGDYSTIPALEDAYPRPLAALGPDVPASSWGIDMPTAPDSGYGAPSTALPNINPLRSPLNQSMAQPESTTWHIHVQCSGNNTIVNFTHESGRSFKKAWFSGGSCGFKGANRNGYEAGYQCAARLFKRIEQQLDTDFPNAAAYPVRIEIFFKGFGKGRDAFLSALTMTEGERVRDRVERLTDRTPIKIGGTRSKKMKRR
jgi:small subunit ribosomal protein S11